MPCADQEGKNCGDCRLTDIHGKVSRGENGERQLVRVGVSRPRPLHQPLSEMHGPAKQVPRYQLATAAEGVSGCDRTVGPARFSAPYARLGSRPTHNLL